MNLSAYGQNQASGAVSYVTDENIYVRFESTQGLHVGDTLLREDGTPCLTVVQFSSISAVANPLNGCHPEVGTILSFTPVIERPVEEQEAVNEEVVEVPIEAIVSKDTLQHATGQGRISTAANTVYSANSTLGGYTRSVTRLSLDVDHLAQRDLSFSFYGNYQAYLRYDTLTSRYPNGGRAQLYNANLKFKPNESWTLIGGRFVSTKTSSLGAIDGLSAERQFGNFYVGAIAGFRPDYVTFGTRLDQFQYGVYGGTSWLGDKSRSTSTFGILEQTLSGATDRRFLYFQHSTSWNNGLTLFASSEADLFENYDTASPKSTFKLTHLYVSANYRLSRTWNLFASYDSRQQIMFYETFDSEVERILSERGMQNGVRFRASYRSRGGWIFRTGAYHRFGSESSRDISNVNLTVGHGKIPWIGGSFTASGQLNVTGTMNSDIASVRYSNSFAKNQVSWSIYGRFLYYYYPQYENLTVPFYWYMGTDWNVRIGDGWQLGVMGEYSLRDQHDILRLNLQLLKRFGW